MRRLLAFAFLCCASAAFAGSYDEFGRGLEANNRGDSTTAISHFSAALAGGDLAPSYRPSAYLGRARALLHERQCREAASDLTAALHLKPDYVDAFALRAEANHCLGRNAAALKDADDAIRLKPAAGYYFTRARLYWLRDDLAKAHADAERAAEADPANGYFVLWAAVTALPDGGIDEQHLQVQSAEVAGWPQPLIALYAGMTSTDAVRRAADRDDTRCEADFFIGQLMLAHGERSDARFLFERATEQCPRDFITVDAARHALKRM